MTLNNPKKKVLIFGVFDCLHDGHRSLIAQGNSLGDVCIVVTLDELVMQLKNHPPRQTIAERTMILVREFPSIKIVKGDMELNSWTILIRENPDIVLLGYDQHTLRKSLEQFLEKNKLLISIVTGLPYKGDTLHSSML